MHVYSLLVDVLQTSISHQVTTRKPEGNSYISQIRNILYMNRAMLRAMYNEVEIFHLSKSFAFNNCFTGYNYTAIGLHIGNNTNDLQCHRIHI